MNNDNTTVTFSQQSEVSCSDHYAALTWLSDQGAAFALPHGRTKDKFDKAWQTTPHDLTAALAHAKRGGNVGILCGEHSGNIVPLDRDVDFPNTVAMLGKWAHTAKIVRDNALERGKLLYRVVGPLPKSAAHKLPGEKHPVAELLSTGRHALAPTSQYNSGNYTLIDADMGIMEVTPAELDYIWHSITGAHCYPMFAPTGDNTEYVQAVMDAWPTIEIFQHFGKDANGTENRNGETRILGNAGLDVFDNKWFCHGDGVGGYQVQAWHYCKTGLQLDKGDKKAWWDVVNEMADAKGIAKPDRKAPAVEPETGEIQSSTWPYEVLNGCICQAYTTDKGDVRHEPLCNFNAWIVADVELDDGDGVERKIVIAGELASGGKLREITIDATEFEAMQWVVREWGARASIAAGRGTKDRLRHAIQLLSAAMEQRYSRSHTGWVTVDGKHIYLHGAGAIGAADMAVTLPKPLAGYALPTDDAVDPVTAMRESIRLLDVAPMRISAPQWAAMYAGVLTEFIPLNALISVEGGSGYFKSSYSATLLNHYGKTFDESHLPADWLSTANSLEKLCFHAKDATIIIDDFRPSTSPSEAKELQQSVSRIARAVGNRQGRGRLDGDSDFRRTYIPRGAVMMTAERKALGKSVNSRILTVDVGPGDIDQAKLTVAQGQRHVYGYAMRGFIEWVGRNWDTLSISLPADVARLRNVIGQTATHKRFPQATAVLAMAFGAAMAYAIEIGAVTQVEAGRLCKECREALEGIVEAQSEATEAEDPALKYLTIIASLIAQDKAYIAGVKGSSNLGMASLCEKLGWHDGTHVYLLPGAYNRVCQYARDEGWTFPSDEETLRKELDRGGYLGKRDEGKLTSRQRVPGEAKARSATTAVLLDRFKEILDSMTGGA